MPYRKRIAEVDREIEIALVEISRQRADIVKRKWDQRKAHARLDELLAALAKQKAQRLRLMAKQRLVLD